MTNGKVNFTELVAKMIIAGRNIPEGIQKMSDRIKGSCSLLLLNKEGIYAARDKLGITPLIIGRRAGSWAVTTESAAFLNLGYKIVKYLQPAEIVLLTKSGLKIKHKGRKTNRICSYLWIYTGFPASYYDDINVESTRERCGECLAMSDKVKADMVCGIPIQGLRMQ